MSWGAVLAGLIPSIGIALLFWYVMRAVVRADRNERAALAREDEARADARAADALDPPSRETPEQ